MKKFVITILAIFYLGVSSGATVQLHFCMGKLIDWSISHEQADKCSNCGMKKAKQENCCKDQQHKLELKESPKASAIVYQFTADGSNAPLTAYKEFSGLYYHSIFEDKSFNNSPPRTRAIPVFIRNCTFRI